MIIYFINYLNNKINEYKKTNRNRNKPNYYRLFLFWLSLIILITAIFLYLWIYSNIFGIFVIYVGIFQNCICQKSLGRFRLHFIKIN